MFICLSMKYWPRLGWVIVQFRHSGNLTVWNHQPLGEQPHYIQPKWQQPIGRRISKAAMRITVAYHIIKSENHHQPMEYLHFFNAGPLPSAGVRYNWWRWFNWTENGEGYINILYTGYECGGILCQPGSCYIPGHILQLTSIQGKHSNLDRFAWPIMG